MMSQRYWSFTNVPPDSLEFDKLVPYKHKKPVHEGIFAMAHLVVQSSVLRDILPTSIDNTEVESLHEQRRAFIGGHCCIFHFPKLKSGYGSILSVPRRHSDCMSVQCNCVSSILLLSLGPIVYERSKPARPLYIGFWRCEL